MSDINATLKKSSDLLNKTVGRDKLLRVLQYFTKFVYYKQLASGTKVPKLLSLSNDISFIRKSYRFLKVLNHLANVDQLVKTSGAYKSKNLIKGLVKDLVLFLSLNKEFFLIIYLFFDQINFFKNLKLIPGNKFPKSLKLAPVFWAVAIANGLGISVVKLIGYFKARKQMEVVPFYQDEKFQQISKRIVWDLLDLNVALNSSNIISGNPVLVQFGGTISSLFGLQQVWESLK